MISGFWKKLKRPIVVLAPMANVTDAAFRRIIATYGKPDVMWTEFVSTDGLCSTEGRKALLIDFLYSEKERPIVAQIFGSTPEHFYKTALLLQELGFDGIDINMGCPDKNVTGKQGAGAALIQEPELAQKIIAETIRGAGNLPVSVKTRLGYNKNVLDTWLKTLLETNLAAITIHARTKKEMSNVPAHWEEITKAVQIRDAFDSSKNKTLILGNGDVQNREEALIKVGETGCDGVMIGRGIFGNPWLFNKRRDYTKINYKEKLNVLVEHTYLFEKLLGKKKNFSIMKKHYKAYVNGFEGAKELRVELMETTNASEVDQLIRTFLRTHKLS
jgi:nifR3 family TIM-barrel protein